MTTVCITPMPEKYRTIPALFRPQHPPIFPDCGPGGPTLKEIRLAQELFSLLDDESKDWYGRHGIFAERTKAGRKVGRPRKKGMG